METLIKSQRIISEISEQDANLYIWADAFIIDRKAQNLSPATIKYYKEKLGPFLKYCERNLIKFVTQLTANDIREYMLHLKDTGHNPGGCHSFFRVIRAFINWWETEIEPDNWKNPFQKVKPPKVSVEPRDPVKIETIDSMLETCNSNTYYDVRDAALILMLADTGLRASEFLSVDLENIDPIKGEITVIKTKSKKYRVAFLGKKSRKALRKYLRFKIANQGPLWTKKNGERLDYFGLRSLIRARAKKANVAGPSLHSFRRFFAIQCLRNGMDIFSLQTLMGLSDLQILRVYLKQSNEDIKNAHIRNGPIDNIS